MLQEESSCAYQDSETNDLESFILSGNLYDAKGILNRFNFDQSVFNACRFLISQQIFFEALYNNNFDEALKVLRGSLHSFFPLIYFIHFIYSFIYFILFYLFYFILFILFIHLINFLTMNLFVNYFILL